MVYLEIPKEVKNKTYMKFFLLISVFCWSIISVSGQIPELVTEEQLNTESVFLDALQLKLLDKYDDALKAFTEIEKKEPDNDVVLFEIASIYETINNFPNAINYIEKAIALQPENTVYRQFAMDLYRMTNDLAKYNLELEYQIEKGKYKEDHFYQLVKNHNKTGNYKESIKVLERLEKMSGYNKKLGLTKARIYQKETDNKKLVKELEKLEKLYPKDVDVLQQVASMYHSANDTKAALATYQKILKIDPQNGSAQIYIASQGSQATSEIQYLRSLGPLMGGESLTKDEKIKQLIPFVPKGGDDPEIFAILLDYADVLQKKYPEDPKVNALHGDIFFNARQPGASVAYYQQSLVYVKSVFEVWQQLMQALDMTGQYRDLEKTAMESLDYYPGQAICYYFAGKAKLIMGHPAAALEILEEGIGFSAQNNFLRSDMKLMMVDASLQLKKNDQAQRLFAEVENMPGTRKDHFYYLEIHGRILVNQGRKTEAEEKWLQAIQNGGNRERFQKLIDGLK